MVQVLSSGNAHLLSQKNRLHDFLLYILGCPPAQYASFPTQDYEPFFVGGPNLNLHLPLESWEGGTTQCIFYVFFFLKHHIFFFKVQRSPTKTGEQSMNTPFFKFVNLVSVVICSYLFLLFLFHPEISKKYPSIYHLLSFLPQVVFSD